MNTIKLFSGMEIPVMVSTTERIFQITTYDGQTVLCNLPIAQQLIKEQECKQIKHYWDWQFKAIGKKEVLEMPI